MINHFLFIRSMTKELPHLRLQLAPLLINNAATSTWPLTTASWRGVSLSNPGTFTKAPLSSSTVATAIWPWLHASCCIEITCTLRLHNQQVQYMHVYNVTKYWLYYIVIYIVHRCIYQTLTLILNTNIRDQQNIWYFPISVVLIEKFVSVTYNYHIRCVKHWT